MKAYESVVINEVAGKRSSWRELALCLSCINLCLLAAGFACVAVLQRDVAALRNEVGLRREFGRTAGSSSEHGGVTRGGPLKVEVTEVSVDCAVLIHTAYTVMHVCLSPLSETLL